MYHRLPFAVILYFLLSSLTLSYAQKSVGSLTVQGTKKCIDNNKGLSNGALQTIQTCNPSSQTQSWNFVNSNVAGKQLLQSSNGYCLDVPGGKGVNGQRLQIWQCSPSNKNQFFSQVGNQIVWNGSKMCLNIRNGQKTGFANGAFLQLYQCNTANPNSNIRLITTPATVTSTLKPVNSPTSSIVKPSTSTVFTSPTSSPSSSPNPPSSNSPLNRYGKPGLTAVFDQTRKRMLAWGYDDRQAPMMAAGRKIGSYYHWENNVVANMPVNVPYIPMYWGVSKTTQWNDVKNTIGNISVPGAVFGFNEPDISSQANMDPISAANLFYNQITQVYGIKGSNLISPPIAWNVDGWLVPFMNACNSLGCGISAIGYHIYIDLAKDAGGNVDNAVALIQSRVTYLYQKYKMPIVLSELGLTQAGGGTAQQLNDFMVKSGHFLDNSPMILAWALSAVFAQGSGWDGYLNSNLAFFNQNGTLSALGSSYMNDDF